MKHLWLEPSPFDDMEINVAAVRKHGLMSR